MLNKKQLEDMLPPGWTVIQYDVKVDDLSAKNRRQYCEGVIYRVTNGFRTINGFITNHYDAMPGEPLADLMLDSWDNEGHEVEDSRFDTLTHFTVCQSFLTLIRWADTINIESGKYRSWLTP
jgi:hypothetical protein